MAGTKVVRVRFSLICPRDHHRLVKALERALVACAVFSTLTSIGVASDRWAPVTALKYRWPPGNRDVVIRLETQEKHSGPGDFDRIRIQVSGRAEFILSKSDGWVKLNSGAGELGPGVAKANQVSNDYVLFLPAKSQRRVLAFLVGYAYASSPGSLDVIELAGDGDPKLILHKDNLGFLGLQDRKGDGIAEIIGYPCLSQDWGNGLETYDPFHVYLLSPLPGGPATLSLPLSKAYNLKHYYGWAGPDCREDVAVVLHPPGGGKAQIMKSADAERLTNVTKRK